MPQSMPYTSREGAREQQAPLHTHPISLTPMPSCAAELSTDGGAAEGSQQASKGHPCLLSPSPQ